MNRSLLLSAAVVILAANAWVLVSTHQNRREPSGGTLRLTERELPLAELPGESTVTVLRLQWDVPSESPDEGGAPAWLNAAKLSELGFDCHVPVDAPQAREHYGALTPRPVFVVLEFEGEAWRQARPDRQSRSRLFAVDAGREAAQLRKQYPDTNRHAIVRGVVRPFYDNRKSRETAAAVVPRLGGWIQALMPTEIFVPQPYCRVLAELRQRQPRLPKTPDQSPRYAVTVSWGAHFEPWVRDVVRLPTDPSPKSPTER